MAPLDVRPASAHPVDRSMARLGRAVDAVRRIRRIGSKPPSPSATITTQPETSATRTTQRLAALVRRCRRHKSSSAPESQAIAPSAAGLSADAAASRRELSAAQRVLFIPELLELVLFHVPSLQVLTTVRQVHPFFKDLVHSSPILAWQTWTSKSSTPPRTTSPAIPPSLIPPLYISSTSPLPKLVPSPSTQSSTPSPDPALELCDLLHPILSKWWKTIARNTANYRFFQVDSCVYNRFFPPDLLRRINCTRPALHIDDLVLSFTSTYAFLSYGCTHNITLDDREGHEGRSRRGGDSRNDGGRNAPHLHAADSDDDLISTGHGSVSGSYDDNTVTIEKLLRMMWIPLSETLRRSRDEKFLRLSGLMCTRTMTVTVKARSRDGCEERPVAELHLECMEPYDVTIDRVF